MIKTADEIINMISIKLRECNGETIAYIANEVLADSIKYVEDSLFEIDINPY